MDQHLRYRLGNFCKEVHREIYLCGTQELQDPRRSPPLRLCPVHTVLQWEKRNHSATDKACPFWKHRFDREWLRKQFPAK
ncbi:hypothetical protein AGABI2DRAFT_136070 [Agaricus bisporus var. bisporus H97]|uniref:hypothetical protein n=1 Tax=Agaricus bisporus var. bisporus (strain H97 / ATCC MYA-4626 / FGSC 10389) TaxID=936046 RepID=UPI00029F7E48|nr:hypothetical protein AGABI2DRAFT_136070 [Agaricus bisporus var. bisporus H97]EKV47364.1 hypothetical protein AGABI2DRAFT_136070 [Agaricus bisporus var. bisporus H97]